MGVRVVGSLDDVARDLTRIKARAPKDMQKATSDSAKKGAKIAKGYAAKSSGTHAKQYPSHITAETTDFTPGGIISAEYGPEPVGQGMLAPILENGSVHNPPHHDLAKSADEIVPFFSRTVDGLADRWFW